MPSIEHILPISGTIIKARPEEGWNAIDLVDPGHFTNWEYLERYCNATKGYWGWDFSGASNTEELHEYLKTIMVRRLKSEVLPELPDKIRDIVPIELTNRKEYNIAEDDFLKWLKKIDPEKATKAEKAETLVKMNYMKRLCIEGKMKGVIQWIKDFIETEDKLIVFAIHKSTIDALMKEFGKIAVKLDGSSSSKQREEAKEAFQTNLKIKLFFGNIQAAGEAIELTASSYAAFVELSDTPGDHDQAEDRCYGRLNDCHGATFPYLMAGDTIEIQLAQMLDRKRIIVDAILDGKKTESKDLLMKMLNEIKEAA
jgi:SWI/SNF-related matrix-associated actin-dependent regulator 1 of chromatin subfamily A